MKAVPFFKLTQEGADIIVNAAVEKAYGGKRKVAWFEVFAGEASKTKFDNWLPDDTVDAFKKAGGKGPVFSQLTLCWGSDRDEAIELAHRQWPNTGLLFWAYVTTVPLTLLTLANLVAAWVEQGPRRRWWLGAAVSLGLMVVSFAVQGLGHKREAEAPVPFDGPGDFLARVFVEQFITFPRFVLSGGWMRQLSSRD